jgi:hypothetical protein
MSRFASSRATGRTLVPATLISNIVPSSRAEVAIRTPSATRATGAHHVAAEIQERILHYHRQKHFIFYNQHPKSSWRPVLWYPIGHETSSRRGMGILIRH